MTIENGDVLAIDRCGAEVVAKEFLGRTFIDGTYGQVEDVVVRDRKHLSYDGIVVPVVAINPVSGELESEPEVVTRGFVHEEEAGDFLAEIRAVVENTVTAATHEERIDGAVIKEKIRLDLRRFLQKSTGRRPMIIPVVLEV
jgi:ribonuclease J